MPITVRPVTDADFAPITRFDLTYSANRYLQIDRDGSPPEHSFTLAWREHDAPDEVYAAYTEEWLRDASARADTFLVAEIDGRLAGLMTLLLPSWTDAVDVGDLGVDRLLRGKGAASALIDAAAKWARERSRRALWVEPHANDAPAIEFYLRRGFRISGFNDRLYSNQDDASGRPTIYMHLEL